MASVAVSREAASFVLVEPRCCLEGMTSGGISDLGWRCKETVGGSTDKSLGRQSGNQVDRTLSKDLADAYDCMVIHNQRIALVAKNEINFLLITRDDVL